MYPQGNLLTNFYIVRHGETEGNIRGIVQGHINSPLTERGEKQAERLAKELNDVDFDEVFSSDLVRAKRTAEIITLEKKLEVKTTEILRERSYGLFEGTNTEQFHELYVSWEKLNEEQRWYHKFLDEESHEEIVTRFITFIREISVAYPGKTVLLATHGSIMRSFLIKLGYGTWDSIGGFINCGYINIESDGVDFYLKTTRGVKNWEEFEKQLPLHHLY